MTPNPSSAAPLNDPADLDPDPSAGPATVRRLRLVEPAPQSITPSRPAFRVGSSGLAARTARPAPPPAGSLEQYRSAGGLRGLRTANAMTPAEIAATVLDSGLRGRGGGGFPTGRKWQTVAANAAAGPPATVVVNGAEGEPGTLKDRSILRHNPYQVIEGAFIAARATHADRVIIALKGSFTAEVRRTRAALAEMRGREPGASPDRMLRLRRTRPLPLRRGERAPGDDRRSRSVPSRRAPVPGRAPR